MKDATTVIGRWLPLSFILFSFYCGSSTVREIPCTGYLGNSVADGKIHLMLLVPEKDGLHERLHLYLQSRIERPVKLLSLDRAGICGGDEACLKGRFPAYRKKAHPTELYAGFLQSAFINGYNRTNGAAILLHVEYGKQAGRLTKFGLYIYIPRVDNPPTSFCRKESMVYSKSITTGEAAIIIGNRIEALLSGETSNEELKGKLLELEKPSGCLGGFSL